MKSKHFLSSINHSKNNSLPNHRQNAFVSLIHSHTYIVMLLYKECYSYLHLKCFIIKSSRRELYIFKVWIICGHLSVTMLISDNHFARKTHFRVDICFQNVHLYPCHLKKIKSMDFHIYLLFLLTAIFFRFGSV